MDVKTLCLGVLALGDASGYEIRKAFEDGPFSHFQEAGFGSIYPALKKLMDEELATCFEHQQDSRPDKKVYQITAKGRQALFDAVNREPSEDKYRSDMMFALFFADLMPIRRVDRIIADRIDHHGKILQELKACEEEGMAPGPAFVLRFGQAMHACAKAYLENHQHELIGGVLQRDVAQ